MGRSISLRDVGSSPDVLAYRAREHAVGAFAFDTSADLQTVSEHLSTFLQVFCPKEGLRVRASRGAKTEILGTRFTPTSSVRATQLARGGSVDLARQDFEPVNGKCAHPLFWVASRPSAESEIDDIVPLRFGFSIGRPGADRPEQAIAHALDTFIEACVELKGCVSAIVTAQGPATSLATSSLAYEALAGTAAKSLSVEWLRSHVRSPGWRVLVPTARARDLSKEIPAGVRVERVRSGLLARIDAPTPWAMAETEALERWLLPLLA